MARAKPFDYSKNCGVCGRLLVRKRRKDGRLETPAQYTKRKTCQAFDCQEYYSVIFRKRRMDRQAMKKIPTISVEYNRRRRNRISAFEGWLERREGKKP